MGPGRATPLPSLLGLISSSLGARNYMFPECILSTKPRVPATEWRTVAWSCWSTEREKEGGRHQQLLCGAGRGMSSRIWVRRHPHVSCVLQYDWCSWIPNAPPTMRAPPPTAKGVVTIEQIVDTLPDRGRSCWHLGAVWALSQFQDNEVSTGHHSALSRGRLPGFSPFLPLWALGLRAEAGCLFSGNPDFRAGGVQKVLGSAPGWNSGRGRDRRA